MSVTNSNLLGTPLAYMITFHQGESILGSIKRLLSNFNAAKREININWLTVIKGSKTHQPKCPPISLGDLNIVTIA